MCDKEVTMTWMKGGGKEGENKMKEDEEDTKEGEEEKFSCSEECKRALSPLPTKMYKSVMNHYLVICDIHSERTVCSAVGKS